MLCPAEVKFPELKFHRMIILNYILKPRRGERLVAEEWKKNLKAPEGRKVIFVCRVAGMPEPLKNISMDTELNADYLIPEPADSHYAPPGLFIALPVSFLPTFRPAVAFFLAGIFATNVSPRWGLFDLT